MNAVTEAMKDLPNLIARSTRVAEAGGKLRQCVVEIRHRQGRALEDLLAIGAELAKARDILRGAYETGHVEGEWLRWLRDDLQMSHMQAANFIRVWERYGKGGLNTCLTPTSFRVLAELAAPEADPEAVAEIEQKIAKGERVTVREAAKAKKAKKKDDNKKKAAKPGNNREALDRLKAMWQSIEGLLDRHPDVVRRRFYAYVSKQMKIRGMR